MPTDTPTLHARFNITPARLGAILALLAVALGAFGAHSLKGRLDPYYLGVFETGVRYQMYHALGLMILAALPGRAYRAWPFLFSGTLIFSGSLYALVFTKVGLFGAVAPIGGLLLMLGWILVAVGVGQAERTA